MTGLCVDDDGRGRPDHDYTAWTDRPVNLPPRQPTRLRWCVNCNHYDPDPPSDAAQWTPQEDR